MQRLRTRLRASASTGAPPSLSLDFLGLNQTLDSRVTFSRGSNATLVDSTGKVTYAPNNLLLRSEEFDNASWVKYASSVTANSTTAPDGTVTADTFTANGTSANHRIQQVFTAGLPRVMSVYVKAGTATFVQIMVDADAAPWANFDLTNGTVGSTGSNQTASITAVGNGWYRCALYSSSATMAGLNISIVSSASASRAEINSSSGTVFLWGAQLEAVTYQTTPSTYNATTASAYYGPRFDYDPVTLNPKGLLIEEQRTNLLTYSEQFDNAAWLKSATTVTANAASSPDGITTSDKAIVNNGTALGAASAAGVRQVITKAASAITYTYTVFAKAAEFNSIVLFIANSAATSSGRCQFNLAAGTASATTTVGSFTGVSASIANAGGGWYRCSITATSDTATDLRGDVWPTDTVATTGNGTSGVLIWGAQLEAGAFATSYIPTVASTVTRSADVATMTGTNFSSWYNQSEGTIFASVDTAAPTGSTVLSFQDGAGASTNRHQMNIYSSFTATVVSNVIQSNIGTNTNTSPKLVYAYKANDFAACANGAAVATDTSGTVPTSLAYATLGKWDFGSGASLNGHIRRIAYYPTRLADYQLQGLTA